MPHELSHENHGVKIYNSLFESVEQAIKYAREGGFFFVSEYGKVYSPTQFETEIAKPRSLVPKQYRTMEGEQVERAVDTVKNPDGEGWRILKPTSVINLWKREIEKFERKIAEVEFAMEQEKEQREQVLPFDGGEDGDKAR